MISKGVDIVSIERIERACRNRRFCQRVFTERELREGSSSVGLARLFALKEAFLKALGTGVGSGLSWKDVEFLCRRGEVCLYGNARRLAGRRKVRFSVAHTRGVAIATVVIE